MKIHEWRKYLKIDSKWNSLSYKNSVTGYCVITHVDFITFNSSPIKITYNYFENNKLKDSNIQNEYSFYQHHTPFNDLEFKIEKIKASL